MARDLFCTFCFSVLAAWMNAKHVYFVLMDGSPFLCNVEQRNDFGSSPFKFPRRSLQLIRPNKIEQIIRNTRVETTRSESPCHRWGLYSDKDIKEAARLMYAKTRPSAQNAHLVSLVPQSRTVWRRRGGDIQSENGRTRGVGENLPSTACVATGFERVAAKDHRQTSDQFEPRFGVSRTKSHT